MLLSELKSEMKKALNGNSSTVLSVRCKNPNFHIDNLLIGRKPNYSNGPEHKGTKGDLYDITIVCLN